MAAIIAGIILIGFVLSVPHTREIPGASLSESTTPHISSVSLHDSFKKGLHTITGSIEVPNACASVIAEASLTGEASTTSRILVAILLPEDTGVCLQVPTVMHFSTTISAPAGLPIEATVNGIAATTSVS